MTGIQENEKAVLKPIMVKHLIAIPKFEAHSEYISDCILNGLVMQSPFEEIKGIGLTNNENHSVRNITDYPRYKEEVTILNKILFSFINEQP